MTQELCKLDTSEIESITNKTPDLKNKGTSAGGFNTNKSGLSYEEITDLNNKTIMVKNFKTSKKIKFYNSEKIFTQTKKANLFKYMKDKLNKNIAKGHGCKQPDECYIDEELKNMFIIETKFQKCSGSICEKIQSGDFKLWQYSRTFPDYNIIYIYCLSDWYKINCIAELEYLDYKKIPYFWGSSKTYKNDIINFILNYK